MKTLPTLYKKTNTGAIQFWKISTSEQESLVREYLNEPTWWKIVTTYGQLDTDSPQETVDYIKKGKNIGKKNETIVSQQAESEAQAKWEKQKKKGYVETVESAQAGEVDEVIEGGMLPMLAESYLDVIFDKRAGHENDPPQFLRTRESQKIKFIAWAQPKLDGIRCIAMVKDGKCTLWSRTRKRINSMPHIVAEIESIGFLNDTILDGELYNHELKDDFERIVSIVRKDEPEEGYLDAQYHIYDMISEGEFLNRKMKIAAIFGTHQKTHGDFKYLKRVMTWETCSDEELMKFFFEFRSMGYEGAIVRNESAEYQSKRTTDLQKLKEFHDDEFEIVGIEEGRGKLMGHAGKFICKMKNGETFKAKLEGETSNLKKYFDDHSLWEGKMLTVRYQGFTKYGIPRIPVAKSIRDYE
jgi:ATP-dependent DNA ligase